MAETGYRLRGPGQRRGLPRIELTGTVMKLYGCVAMFFYSLSRSVFQLGLIGMDRYGEGELSAAMAQDPHLMMLSGWASVFQLIGGLAVPVFAFLLVEGFRHTSSFKRYFLTMVAFAVISEAPYDLAMSGKVWDMSAQSVMVTYCLCLVMLFGLEAVAARKGFLWRLIQVMLVVATALWTMMLQTAFGLVTVLLAAIYYFFYDKRGMGVLLGCGVSILYVTAPLSGYVIYNYSGRRGDLADKYKYVFYALYPAHLLALGLIAKAIA